MSADLLPSGDGAQLIELQRMCQEDKAVLEPGFENSAWYAIASDQGAQQNIGVENDPHGRCALLPTPFPPKFGAHRSACLVDQRLRLFAGQTRIALLDIAHRGAQHFLPDRVLDEPRQVAFLAAPLGQVGS